MPERRILIVGRRDGEVLPFLEALTGSLPTHQHAESHAGMSHTLDLKTQYYTTSIPIWLDEIADAQSWSASFSSSEAREVRQVLGSFIYTFKHPTSPSDMDLIKSDLKALEAVVKACGGFNWDGVCLAVSMPHKIQPQMEVKSEEWEELCLDVGFEYVDFEAKGRNDYGEPVGMERLRESLEANDWNARVGIGLDDFDEDELDRLGDEEEEEEVDKDGNVRDGLKLEANEMEGEMFGLHQAVLDAEREGEEDQEAGGDDITVENLEAAMQRLKTVRDIVAELPEDQKRAFAAKAVADVMKTL